MLLWELASGGDIFVPTECFVPALALPITARALCEGAGTYLEHEVDHRPVSCIEQLLAGSWFQRLLTGGNEISNLWEKSSLIH